MKQLEKLQKAIELSERLRAQITAKIKSLPDNPRIRRLSDRCFILQSKDLGCNWTPEYHDFKRQYGLLSQCIERKRPETLLSFLKTTVQESSFKVNNNYTVKLHPDVVGYLRSLFGVTFLGEQKNANRNSTKQLRQSL